VTQASAAIECGQSNPQRAETEARLGWAGVEVLAPWLQPVRELPRAEVPVAVLALQVPAEMVLQAAAIRTEPRALAVELPAEVQDE